MAWLLIPVRDGRWRTCRCRWVAVLESVACRAGDGRLGSRSSAFLERELGVEWEATVGAVFGYGHAAGMECNAAAVHVLVVGQVARADRRCDGYHGDVGPAGDARHQRYGCGQLGAETPAVGEHFPGERELRVDGEQAVGVEQHDEVAVRRRPGQRLHFGDLMTGAGAERHFDQRAPVSQARVRRAAADALSDQDGGLADREAERRGRVVHARRHLQVDRRQRRRRGAFGGREMEAEADRRRRAKLVGGEGRVQACDLRGCSRTRGRER